VHPGKVQSESTGKSKSPDFRITVILDSTRVSKYVINFCEWAISCGNIKLTVLLISPLDTRKNFEVKQKRLKRVIVNYGFVLINKIESHLLNSHKSNRDHLDEFHIYQNQDSAKFNSSDNIKYYQACDLENYDHNSADLVVDFTSGGAPKEILVRARFGGVIFQNPALNTEEKNWLGFEEVLKSKDLTSLEIWICNKEYPLGSMVVNQSIPTKHFFLLNQAALFLRRNYHLRLIIKRLISENSYPLIHKRIESSDNFKASVTTFDQVHYLMRQVQKYIGRKIRYMFKRNRVTWNVGFYKGTWDNFENVLYERLFNPKGHFLADPFVVSTLEGTFCFLEDYDFGLRKGAIACYQLDLDEPKRLGLVLDEDFHLSFPYIFEFESKLYMCPETSEIGEIRLYECTQFPNKWDYVKTIIPNVNAVDSMIFSHQDLWWLLTNVDPMGSDDFAAGLFLFSTDNPLLGKWVPHPENPVHPRNSRNGGILYNNGEVYRVGQVKLFFEYGSSTTINKITNINRVHYSEECVAQYFPKNNSKIVGSHHLHSNQKFTIFDFLQPNL